MEFLIRRELVEMGMELSIDIRIDGLSESVNFSVFPSSAKADLWTYLSVDTWQSVGDGGRRDLDYQIFCFILKISLHLLTIPPVEPSLLVDHHHHPVLESTELLVVLRNQPHIYLLTAETAYTLWCRRRLRTYSVGTVQNC